MQLNEAPHRKQRGIFTRAMFLSPQAAGNLLGEIKSEISKNKNDFSNSIGTGYVKVNKRL
jgi:hypothetical protein